MAPRTKVEKRMDADEGVKYTQYEFIEYYGAKKGAKKWEAAGSASTSKPAKGGKACTVCGNDNHVKADCKFKDMECSTCGKVGHLKKVCRSAGGADDKKGGEKANGKACSVCGKTNHLKADCKFKDKECSTCGKTGHLAAVCRSTGAKDGAKPNAKAKAKANAKACTVCGNTNHVKADCKFKDEECSICGKVGHLKKVCRAEGGGASGDKKSDDKVSTGNFKVCVVGGAGGIGQPLCLLMAMDPNVAELNVYDLTISMVPAAGVSADLSHINKRCKVNSFSFDKDAKAIDVAEECLTGCDLVLVPAGVPRKPGQDRKDLLNINCGIAKNIVEACAKFCPKAVIGLIVNPVNSVVPAMTELWKKKGLDPKKIAGVTTLDVVRAGKFVHNITGDPIKRINIPVVGGHAGVTILPLFSQDKSSAKIDAEKIPELDKSVQDAGTVVVSAKAGKGSATLSMAFAGARFGSSVLRGLTGKRTTECAYVESSIQEGLTYFTSKVSLGKDGVEKVHVLGELNEYEKGRLAELTPTLLEEIQCGLDYAKENEFA